MAERIIIERTDAEQGFHVRFVNEGNNEKTFWCENLKTRASALKVIVSHARTFVDDLNVEVVKDSMQSALALRIHDGFAFRDIAIEQIDSRAKKSKA